MDAQRSEAIVEDMLKRSGKDIQVKLEDRSGMKLRIGGKFNAGTGVITMYRKEIEDQCRELFPHENVYEDYFKVVLAHEFGHATDPLLAGLADLLDAKQWAPMRHKIMLLIEANAWKNAGKLIPEIPVGFYKKIRGESLKRYYETINIPEPAVVS